MDILKIVGVAMAIAIMAVALHRQDGTWRMLLVLAGGTVLVLLFLPAIEQVLALLRTLGALSEGNGAIFTILLRVLGISYLVEFAAQACEDAGEKGIGSKIVLGGKLAIVVVIAPTLVGLVEQVMGLMT
ncbi:MULTISPECIES: SpoIIIAC/SpoIIIAD family protein [unclassified Clostridium]|uniref:SpoIIIAC/SpoIIIAD family protein n=1 Tax=unclassified Clostridium TaxID=2614128 RepID=UPI001106603D|nr:MULTISPECIES: SpoIIIAC/SpoIIIAD family protein [unclassified Clostridium]